MVVVEVTTPEAFTGDIVGDLASRRGEVASIGRGSAAVKPEGYAVLPDAIARDLMRRG